MDESVVSR